MPYKLAIFDFDGTLADSFPWVVSVMDQVADEFGLPRIAQDDIENLRHMGARQILQKYRVPFWKIVPIGRRVMQLMSQNIQRIRPFDGVDDLLQRLAEQGVALALVTTNTEANVLQVLGPQNAGRFQAAEYKVSLFGKAERLKKILRRQGLPPHAAIYIGDELRDLDAARKAHIPFGAVAWGYTHPDALLAHGSHEVFATLPEIVAKIVTER